jgi:hypothetical protein
VLAAHLKPGADGVVSVSRPAAVRVGYEVVQVSESNQGACAAVAWCDVGVCAQTDNFIVSLCVHAETVWAGTEGVVAVYNAGTYSRDLTLKAHTKQVTCVASVDSARVWSGSADMRCD